MLKVLMAGGLAGASAGALREFMTDFDSDDAPSALTQNMTMAISKPFDDKPKKKKVPAIRRSLTGEYKFSSVKEAGDEAVIEEDPDKRSPTQKDMGIPRPDAPDIWDLTKAPTAIIAAGGLGAYGGYKGVGWLAKKYRNWRAQAELEDARTEYEELLKERYGLAKSSALAGYIDSEYANFEKKSDWLKKVTGVGLGSGLAILAGIAALSHMAAKKNADSTDPNKLRRKLVEQRMKLMQAHMPSTAVFRLPEDEEEDGGYTPSVPGMSPIFEGGKSSAVSPEDTAIAADMNEASQQTPENQQKVVNAAGGASKEVFGDVGNSGLLTKSLKEQEPKFISGVEEAVSDFGRKKMDSFGLSTFTTPQGTP